MLSLINPPAAVPAPPPPRQPACVAVGQHKAAIAEVDTAVEPLGAGFAANHDEDSGSGLAFTRACPGDLEREGPQAAVAWGVDNPRAQVDLHVRGRLELRDQV